LSIIGFPNVSPASLLATTNGFLGPVLSSQNVTYTLSSSAAIAGSSDVALAELLKLMISPNVSPASLLALKNTSDVFSPVAFSNHIVYTLSPEAITGVP
jgi:hypothetical protein